MGLRREGEKTLTDEQLPKYLKRAEMRGTRLHLYMNSGPPFVVSFKKGVAVDVLFGIVENLAKQLEVIAYPNTIMGGE